MTREELKQISEAAGEQQRWDFSSMRTDRDPVPWDYVDVVKR